MGDMGDVVSEVMRRVNAVRVEVDDAVEKLRLRTARIPSRSGSEEDDEFVAEAGRMREFSGAWDPLISDMNCSGSNNSVIERFDRVDKVIEAVSQVARDMESRRIDGGFLGDNKGDLSSTPTSMKIRADMKEKRRILDSLRIAFRQ
mmetsp:Transcript_14644/g.29843  ORF Transcript_14644/g.29843 Transcript_14644/m.29843 type:complete len:146 (+) Transcript_14644:224-661(+)